MLCRLYISGKINPALGFKKVNKLDKALKSGMLGESPGGSSGSGTTESSDFFIKKTTRISVLTEWV